MEQTAKIILDSISPEGIRLTTMQLRYWRPIHAELMTHRVFSRNARSSRAVPVHKLLKEEIYMPRFMLNRPGMQSVDELTDAQRKEAERIWESMAEDVRHGVRRLMELGVHKQWANRPLEWFGWIDVLVTSTDWANFFALRVDEGAQPDIYDLAYKMKRAMDNSSPSLLHPGEWHLPYITPEEYEACYAFGEEEGWDGLKRLSVARCARLSYEPFDGNASPEKEEERYNRLVGSHPVHASPAEHQATPDEKVSHPVETDPEWHHEDQHGNFYGWRQYRKMIPGEAIQEDNRA